LLQAILTVTAAIESLGAIAVVIGIFFILHHFNTTASTAFIWVATSVLVVVPLLEFLGLTVYAIINRKELAAKQQTAATPPMPPTTEETPGAL